MVLNVYNNYHYCVVKQYFQFIKAGVIHYCRDQPERVGNAHIALLEVLHLTSSHILGWLCIRPN